MQQTKLQNLITKVFFTQHTQKYKTMYVKKQKVTHNNKSYYVKHNNSFKSYYVKKQKLVNNINSLSNTHNILFKHYKCNLQQLQLIQFVYNTNCYKQTTYAYNVAQRNTIINACTSM